MNTPQQPRTIVIVTCAFCDGTGKQPPYRLTACVKCDGAGKRRI